MSDRATALEKIEFEDTSSLAIPSRPGRANIAQDTLNKLQAGWYDSKEGSRIELEDDIIFCNDNSVLYTEDDLENPKKIISAIDEMDSTSSTISTASYTNIEVRYCTTLQAARSLVAEMGEDHVGVLNFASAKNPGGGFLKGSQSQEESIARSSSLYLALTQDRLFSGYYKYNRCGARGIYSHRMIYSPRVTIFKDDNGELLSVPYHVGIVTAPAPNAGVIKDTDAIRNAMTERVKRLLYVFKAKSHDSLVLGAYGCGVFRNNPFDVAMIFRRHLELDEFKNFFKRIIFAISNTEMGQVFEQVFTATDLNNIQRPIMPISLGDANNRRNNRDKQHKKSTKQKRIQNNHFKQVQGETNSNHGDQEDSVLENIFEMFNVMDS